MFIKRRKYQIIIGENRRLLDEIDRLMRELKASRKSNEHLRLINSELENDNQALLAKCTCLELDKMALEQRTKELEYVFWGRLKENKGSC